MIEDGYRSLWTLDDLERLRTGRRRNKKADSAVINRRIIYANDYGKGNGNVLGERQQSRLINVTKIIFTVLKSIKMGI